MASRAPPKGTAPLLAPPASSRAPIKAIPHSSAQRRAMTDRRVQLSDTIRKARRSHAVTLKRRFGAGSGGGANAASPAPVAAAELGAAAGGAARPPPGVAAAPALGAAAAAFPATALLSSAARGTGAADPVGTKLVDLASAYVRASRYEGAAGAVAIGGDEAGSLSALQAALAKSEADGRSIDSLLRGGPSLGPTSSDDRTPALLLSEALARSLSSPSGGDEVRLDASRVLTNLAATGTAGGSRGGDADDYYGVPIEGWCDVIVRSSALSALVGAVDVFGASHDGDVPAPRPPSRSAVALCEQCCWALGNVAGDSQRARDAARAAGAVGPLVRALRAGFHWGRRQRPAGPADADAHTVGLCRNAAWALSNLARGAFTPALPFLAARFGGGGALGGAGDGAKLLSARDLAELLAAPELAQGPGAPLTELHVDSIDGEATVPDSSWADVANETSWIVAFLAAREDEAVDFLVGGDSPLCEALAYRLSKASNDAANAAGESAEAALRMCVPCIRAVGNVAAACDGQHVARLITTHGPNFFPIPSSLARLIQLGSLRGGDFASVASETAWAAGTLLCDAGRPPPHPSTAACDVLLPALCDAASSGLARLELKREAVSALFNAVSPPPVSVGGGAAIGGDDDDTAAVRDQILRTVSEADGLIGALTGLLLSFDADAVFASVQVVDALLRRLGDVPRVRRLFEEASILDALETVCDRASGASTYGQEAWRGDGSSASERSAEIAADLIDDLFGEEALAREEAEPPTSAVKTLAPSGEVRYAFGTEAAGISPVGGFDFSNGGAVFGQVPPTGQGMGRGRGRGKVVPSWMQKQQG